MITSSGATACTCRYTAIHSRYKLVPRLRLRAGPHAAVLSRRRHAHTGAISTSSWRLPSTARVAQYARHGEMEQVIEVVEQPLPPLQPDQLLVRFLAAPINPSDLNQIQGNYHIQPPLPAVAGNEGVAQVMAVGSAVDKHRVGDWVIPSASGFGTWRDYAITHQHSVDTIDNKSLTITQAATLSVNPSTAYRLLHDFVSLTPGDTIVQNGATSAVGQAVIQIAAAMQVNTINIIRPRSDAEQTQHTIQQLKGLGATHVLTEEQLTGEYTRTLLSSIPQQHLPRLALNCIGGSVMTAMTRLLTTSALVVTYGGMSLRPVTIPTSKFIFQDLHCCGFWMTKWNETHSAAEKARLRHQLTQWFKQGKLQIPVQCFPFDQLTAAMQAVRQPYREKKVVLTFRNKDIK